MGPRSKSLILAALITLAPVLAGAQEDILRFVPVDRVCRPAASLLPIADDYIVPGSARPLPRGAAREALAGLRAATMIVEPYGDVYVARLINQWLIIAVGSAGLYCVFYVVPPDLADDISEAIR